MTERQTSRMTDPTTMPMQTPEDLFVHELSDMLSAEQIIVQMLGEAQALVQHPQLRDGMQLHQQQSQEHAERISQILTSLGTEPHPVQCYAAAGLWQQLREAQQANPSPAVLEGLVVGGAARTEHLEIAAYTGLIAKAQAMGQTNAVALLQQNLRDEEAMLQQVEQLSQRLTRELVRSVAD